MKLDIRLPIGLLFSIVGALLTVFGMVSGTAIYQRSLGVNINLLWGIVLLLFGLTMLGLGWHGMKTRHGREEKG